MALEQLRKTTLGHPDSIFGGIDVDEKSENAVTVGGPIGTGVDMHQLVAGVRVELDGIRTRAVSIVVMGTKSASIPSS